MAASVEMRYEDCGFVYTKRTRMLFSPKFTVTRRDDDRGDRALVLQAASNWEEPNRSDINQCREALVGIFPDREIFADTSNGLVPIYQPEG